MKDSILDKLGALLKHPIEDEPKALYLMAELRKLSEQEGRLPNSLTLWMHWALHVKLEAASATYPILKEIDDCIHQLCEGDAPLGPPLLAFNVFKHDLRARLDSHKLPTEICDNPDWWSKFIAAYSSVIEDGGLTLKAPHAHELRYVTKVTFTKEQALPMGDFPFTINWNVFLRNCKFKEVIVRPMPNENKYRFTGWSYLSVNAD